MTPSALRTGQQFCPSLKGAASPTQDMIGSYGPLAVPVAKTVRDVDHAGDVFGDAHLCTRGATGESAATGYLRMLNPCSVSS